MKHILTILTLSLFASTASAGIINITAFIDGTSELVIEDDTMFWHHSAWAAPGRWSGNDYPTTVNGIEWLPEWPVAGRNDFCDCDSSSITGLFPALSELSDISLSLISGRGTVSLLDSPSSSNNHRMEIEFDDYYFGGAEWYEIEISYYSVPEPSSLFLLSAGLMGLVLRRKRKC